MAYNGITERQNFHRIWNTMKQTRSETGPRIPFDKIVKYKKMIFWINKMERNFPKSA